MGVDTGAAFSRRVTCYLSSPSAWRPFIVGILNIGPALALVGVGTVATKICVFVLGPVIARPIMGLLGAPAEAMAHSPGACRENIKRNPRRTRPPHRPR